MGGDNHFQYAPSPVEWVDPLGLSKKPGGCKDDCDNTNTTRVGRWMSEDEYLKMLKTGRVQESGGGMTHVASPENINAFNKQAAKGSCYVTFDVPIDQLRNGGTPEWGIIFGPNSIFGRLANRKGANITQMPVALNIIKVAIK